jgi:hypothetical protein
VQEEVGGRGLRVWTVGLERVRVRGLLIYESSSNVDR